MPQRNASQISDMAGNKNMHDEQAANLRQFVNQQKMRQQQRPVYLGKKNGAMAMQNSLQRSSLGKLATEQNSLSNSLSSQGPGVNGRIIVNNNQISIGQLVFAASPSAAEGQPQIINGAGNNYGDAQHRAVMSVIQQQLPSSVSGSTLQAVDGHDPIKMAGNRPNNYRSISIPKLPMHSYIGAANASGPQHAG